MGHHHDRIRSRHNVATRQLRDDAATHGGTAHALAELLHDFVHGTGSIGSLETRRGGVLCVNKRGIGGNHRKLWLAWCAVGSTGRTNNGHVALHSRKGVHLRKISQQSIPTVVVVIFVVVVAADVLGAVLKRHILHLRIV